MRPVLKPGLRRVWRNATTLQFGVDPDRAVVFSGLTPEALGTLELLDGTRLGEDVAEDAGLFGVRPEQADALVDVLLAAGLLDDAAGVELGHSPLAPELAGISLAHPEPGAAARALERRQAAHVRVLGAGRIGALVARLLAAAGVGGISVVDPLLVRPCDLLPGGHRPDDVGLRREDVLGDLPPPRKRAPDLLVVAPPGVTDVPLSVALELASSAVPHLLVRVRELTGIVGPLVLPGVTCCLACLHLHRRDRDGAWPIVSAQVSGERDHDPGDVALCTLVGGLAVMQALAYLDRLDGSTLPVTTGGALELTVPDWRVRRRSWPGHPECACARLLDPPKPPRGRARGVRAARPT